MHIGFVEWAYPSKRGGGGAGTYVKIVGTELVRRGHQVSVVTSSIPGEPERSVESGMEIHRVKTGFLHWYISRLPFTKGLLGKPARLIEWGLNVNRRLRAIHRRSPLDVVEYNQWCDPYNTFVRNWPAIMHAHGSSFVFKRHCGERLDRGDWIQHKLEGYFSRRADVVLAPSQALLTELTIDFGLATAKTCVIPLPIEHRSFQTIGDAKDERLPVVLFVGRIEPRKGADILFQAIPAIVRQFESVRFVFCGSESALLPFAGIQSALEEHGIQSHVDIKSFIPREAVLEQYAKADIFVMPSRWENSPYVIYEAMSSGLPVIASRVGGIPELVVEGETGVLVPPGDVSALSTAIVRILEDEPLRHAMGQRGRQHIEQYAGLAHNVDKRIALYDSLESG